MKLAWVLALLIALAGDNSRTRWLTPGAAAGLTPAEPAPEHHEERHHVHSNHTSRLRLLGSTPVSSAVAQYGYAYEDRFCSCEDPRPVPLEFSGGGQYPPLAANVLDYYDSPPYSGGEGLCQSLPTARPGGDCGAQIAICPKGFCCSQFGHCTQDPEGCDGTCQCKYSGVDSGCKGSFPFPLPERLPVASAGGLCGAYVATCPQQQCCSQFGFCVDDTSIYCSMPTCIQAASALSSACRTTARSLPGDMRSAGSSSAHAAATATTATGHQGKEDGAKPTTTPQGAGHGANGTAEALGYPRYYSRDGGQDRGSEQEQEQQQQQQYYLPEEPSPPNFLTKAANVKYFEWVATWRDLAPDGFTRPVIVINGEAFPTLQVNVNDRVIVKMTNLLDEPLSIHWHGMLQRRTNIMDGVVPVTQRPVQPGETFIYNFVADTAGTYWWHSHYSTQYVDGLWGALIIKDPTAQVPVDAVVTLNDWYHQGANNLTQWYLSPASGGNEPVPDTALMNGIGQGYCGTGSEPPCSYASIKGVARDCSEPLTMLRVINSGAFAVFNFSIDGHKMIVVGEDAVQVTPTAVGSFQINNGQRYTVLVCQNSSVISEEPVWIRAVMIDSNFANPSNYNTTLGVLYYRDSQAGQLPTSTAEFNPPAMTPSSAGEDIVHPYKLTVLGGITPPGPATMTLEYLIYFYNEPLNDPLGTQYAHFSQISLQMNPETPALVERLSNNPQGMGPPRNVRVPPGGRGWHVVDIPLGSIVDIVINNNDTGEHPIHLHGHWFWVMDAGLPYAGSYDRVMPKNPRAAEDFGRLARDTVTVNTKSYVVLRYLAVNPGVWIMHCHIDWHLAGGLGLLFKEGFPPAPGEGDYGRGQGGDPYGDGHGQGGSYGQGYGREGQGPEYQEDRERDSPAARGGYERVPRLHDSMDGRGPYPGDDPSDREPYRPKEGHGYEADAPMPRV